MVEQHAVFAHSQSIQYTAGQLAKEANYGRKRTPYWAIIVWNIGLASCARYHCAWTHYGRCCMVDLRWCTISAQYRCVVDDGFGVRGYIECDSPNERSVATLVALASMDVCGSAYVSVSVSVVAVDGTARIIVGDDNHTCGQSFGVCAWCIVESCLIIWNKNPTITYNSI